MQKLLRVGASFTSGKEKKEGSYQPGKYADGAVGFVPAMFKVGLVISGKQVESRMCLKFTHSLNTVSSFV